MYCCQTACPGYIAQPFHIPGYTGHLPTIKNRYGTSFGASSRLIMEDPCVALAPCPVLAHPQVYCPPPRPCPPQGPKCSPCPLPCAPCCDPRACHLNRGPYMCPCPIECPDPEGDCCGSGPRFCGMQCGWPRRCC